MQYSASFKCSSVCSGSILSVFICSPRGTNPGWATFGIETFPCSNSCYHSESGIWHSEVSNPCAPIFLIPSSDTLGIPQELFHMFYLQWLNHKMSTLLLAFQGDTCIASCKEGENTWKGVLRGSVGLFSSRKLCYFFCCFFFVGKTPFDRDMQILWFRITTFWRTLKYSISPCTILNFLLGHGDLGTNVERSPEVSRNNWK